MLSNLIHMITAAVAAHPAIAGWLATSLVAIYRTRTPAQWIALGESNARLQGLFKFARGGGFDPARALEGLVQIFTGKRAPNPLELVIASQAARIAELELSLAGYQRRTADAAEHDLSRPTVSPPAPIAPVDRDSQRGSVDLGGLIGCLVVALIAAVIATGCPASRQLTRPALGAVDGCEPRATRCSPAGRPQVCSGSRRWTDADQVCATAVQVAAVCCLTTSPVTGAELHACVLADRCIDRDGGL